MARDKADAYAQTRAGGAADVIVIGSDGRDREGLTGDYLTTLIADPALPRGARFSGTLSQSNGRLVATAPTLSAAP